MSTASRITSHMAGMVIVELKEDGTVFFWVMTYTKNGRTTIRHAAETGDELDQGVEDTVSRGARDEIAKDPTKFKIRIGDLRPVFAQLGEDEKHPGGKHLKAFFLVAVEGELRDFEKQDGDETLGPMRRIEAREFVEGKAGKSIFTHLSAAIGALERLAVNRRVYDKYVDLILKRQPPELAEEEKVALEAYLGR